MKPKALIVLCSDLYIRNYLSTDAFKSVEENYIVTFLISDQIKNKESIGQKEYLTYSMNSKRVKIHFKIFDILMWKHRFKSKTFQFRIQRTIGFHSLFESNTKVIIKFYKIIWRLLRTSFFKIRNYLLVDTPLFKFYLFCNKFLLGSNIELENIVNYTLPDIVIFPSQAYDPEGIDLIEICSKANIPTLFLVDNWDNLSSKTIFWKHPSKLGVWGDQSIAHAHSIQDIHPKNVTAIGTPRYDNYFRLRSTILESPYQFKYILFVGTALEFDEFDVLVKINEIIDTQQNIFQGVKLVYRPHPWRQSVKGVIPKNLKHVVIDSQMESDFIKNNRSVSVQPSLEYYPALLSNAEFVLGGLTSMMIEALIFNKIFLGFVHDDRKNFTSMHNVYENYEHFQGIDSLDAIILCDNLDLLNKKLVYAWNNKNSLDLDSTDLQRQFYYYHDNQSYPDRLKNLVDSSL